MWGVEPLTLLMEMEASRGPLQRTRLSGGWGFSVGAKADTTAAAGGVGGGAWDNHNDGYGDDTWGEKTHSKVESCQLHCHFFQLNNSPCLQVSALIGHAQIKTCMFWIRLHFPFGSACVFRPKHMLSHNVMASAMLFQLLDDHTAIRVCV